MGNRNDNPEVPAPSLVQLTRKPVSEVPTPEITEDPVCGMLVDTSRSAGSHEFEGTTFHFCAVRCLERFRKDPRRYLEAAQSDESGDASAEYFCPMDPEVVQMGPGSCPKCGMALEHASLSPVEEPDAEYLDMHRRLRVAALLTAPVVLLSMGEILPGFRDLTTSMLGDGGPQALLWIQAALSAPVVGWCGFPFFERAIKSIANRSPNMFTLIGIGTATAFIFSLVAIIAPDALPHEMRHPGGVQVYFETAAVITTLVLLGQVLEMKARGKTNAAIRELVRLWPTTATVLTADGSEMTVPREELEAGDLVRVKANESVPTDGVLVEGSSWIDESMVTGESSPVEKRTGDSAIGGTINGSGSFVMRTSGTWEATLLARIITMVMDAQRSRAPLQRLADSVSAYFVPAVIAVALLSMVVWIALGHPQYALVAAVSVLIIACPCALGLATPMSVTVALGEAAKHGVLVRDAEALETLSRIDTLVIDKTGTLTSGRPRVTSVTGFGTTDSDEVVRLAASIERGSEHPLAKAIVAHAEAAAIRTADVHGFESRSGIGVTGRIGETWIEVRRPGEKSLGSVPQGHEADSCVEVVRGGVVIGIITVGDDAKDSARHLVEALRNDGVRIVMLTGDNQTVARELAVKVGIEEFKAGVFPDEKAEFVLELKRAGMVVAMAGDGVNDAPALAAADVSIAMGTGTDVAMEASHITLVKGQLEGIVKARRLSRMTVANIRQNLFFAFFYNLLGVPVAAGALFPLTGTLLSPMIAAAAMTFSSVSVIANALRLRNARLED